MPVGIACVIVRNLGTDRYFYKLSWHTLLATSIQESSTHSGDTHTRDFTALAYSIDMTAHAWQFTSRFRRRSFGWRSATPVQRVKEAVKEIKQVARKEPVVAAEGAVILLEKLSPALEQVDSSSGAIGSAVNKAIETLVPIIAKAGVEPHERQRWLERLWQALQDDDISYMELLGDYWGELCAVPEVASYWADEFLPTLESVWNRTESGFSYFKGTSACLSSLYAAGRYDELLGLINRSPYHWWDYRQWGVQALIAQGKPAEAIQYAEDSRGRNEPDGQISSRCEAILLSAGQHDEAYSRYALEANNKTTHLATFRALVRKYPDKGAKKILDDLIASTPGDEGRWFAAAKDAGLYDIALDVARSSPTDPRTLTRAARDFVEEQPLFACNAGLLGLHWISMGHGYEITGKDVLDAYAAIMKAASVAGTETDVINAAIRPMYAARAGQFLEKILGRHVPGV